MAFLYLFISCEGVFDNPNSKPEVNKPLVPLSLDNQWIYESDDFSGIIVSWIDSIFTFTHEDSQIEMCTLIQDLGDLDWSEKYICYYADDSYNETLYWKIEPDNPTFCFKFPVENGNQWTNDFLFAGETFYFDKYTFQSKNKKIVVPAGTFLCYDYKIDRYREANDSLYYSMNYYFTPGIGLIAIKRTELDSSNPERSIEFWSRRLMSLNVE